MQYTKTLTTKTGSELYLRNGDAPDGDAALAVFNKTHAETEYLLTYPDESSMTAEPGKRSFWPRQRRVRGRSRFWCLWTAAGRDGGHQRGGQAVQAGAPCGIWHRHFAGILGAGNRLCPDSGVHRLRPAGRVSAAGTGRGGGQRTGDCAV